MTADESPRTAGPADARTRRERAEQADVRGRAEQLEDAVILPLRFAGSEDAQSVLHTLIEREVGTKSAVCASLRREERLQYRFVVLYQTLVFVLAVATLILLLVAAWRVAVGGSDQLISAVLSGASAIVTGGAAVWLVGQRRDARKEFRAAQQLLAKYSCPDVEPEGS